MTEVLEKKGIKNGLVYAIILFSVYIYLFFFIGIYFIWNKEVPNTGTDWLVLIGSSIAYLSFSGFLFLVVIITSIYLIFKDISFFQSIKENWTVILAFLYPLLPNLPGPWDEGILGFVLLVIRLILFWKTGKMPEEKKK